MNCDNVGIVKSIKAMEKEIWNMQSNHELFKVAGSCGDINLWLQKLIVANWSLFYLFCCNNKNMVLL